MKYCRLTYNCVSWAKRLSISSFKSGNFTRMCNVMYIKISPNLIACNYFSFSLKVIFHFEFNPTCKWKKICNARFLKGNSERGLKPHDGAYVGGLQDHDTKLSVQWEGLQTEINHLYEPNTEISQSFTFASVINHSPQILIARSLMRTNWKSDRSPRRQSMSRALKAGLFHTPHTKYEDHKQQNIQQWPQTNPQKLC